MGGSDYPLIGVTGPTASGKSDLALCLARRLGGEIVSFDAMQVYRGLDVGTAKVAPEVRAEIPHHLIDVAAVAEFFSAGRFEKLAREALAGIRARGRVPVLVGGTGFYLRALLHGIFEGPERDETLRERFRRIQERRPGSLHHWLARVDPPAAARIAPHDFQRLHRALEVYLLTGRPLSHHFGTSETAVEGFRPRLYFLEVRRAELYERINRRVSAMLEAGLVQEVERLLASGCMPSAKGLEAIGYRQVIAFLCGEISYLEMAEQIRIETRHYAKRQLTWFRREKGLISIEGFGEDPAVQARVLSDVLAFYGESIMAGHGAAEPQPDESTKHTKDTKKIDHGTY